MGSLITLLVVVLVIAAFFLAIAGKGKGATAFPYEKRERLLTKAERSFLGVLESALEDRFRIYAQVRLADLISVAPGTPKSLRTAAQNRINSKHADFVLCDKQTLEIVCAIELDDASHQKTARIARDEFLEKALGAAGLPLARFSARHAYAIPEIRSSLFSLQGIAATSDEPAPAVPANIPNKPNSARISETPANPACPKCGAPSVLRTVKSGARAGSKLWGCSTFPACRGYMPVNT